MLCHRSVVDMFNRLLHYVNTYLPFHKIRYFHTDLAMFTSGSIVPYWYHSVWQLLMQARTINPQFGLDKFPFPPSESLIELHSHHIRQYISTFRGLTNKKNMPQNTISLYFNLEDWLAHFRSPSLPESTTDFLTKLLWDHYWKVIFYSKQ